MTQEEMMQARDIRRYLEKRAVDATLAIITVNKGFVTVSGTIRPQRSAQYTELNDELDMFTKMVMRNVRDVKGVIIDARVKQDQKKEKEHADVAGAHLPGHAANPAIGPKTNLPGHH